MLKCPYRFLLPAVFVLSVHAQSTGEPFHWCTLNAGAGYSAVAGTDGNNLNGQWTFGAGAGFSVIKKPRWSLFLDFDYLYDQAEVKQSALNQSKNLNPTNIALLNATGGTGKFNAVAFDPTVRFPRAGHLEFYAFGGFGWFRREVDLTGPANQGSLLQPTKTATFLGNTQSGSVDGGAGVNFKWKKSKEWAIPYLEVRVVHGLAANHSTTLIPFDAGIRW